MSCLAIAVIGEDIDWIGGINVEVAERLEDAVWTPSSIEWVHYIREETVAVHVVVVVRPV